MSAYPTGGPPGTYIQNETAAIGGPVRPTVSTHYFTGVDIAFLPDFPGQDNPGKDSHGQTIGQQQRRDELLQAAAVISLTAPSTVGIGAVLPIEVDIKNVGAGHNIPSGFSQERQMWVELIVKDANGAVIYESGTLVDSAHPEMGENVPDGRLNDEDLQNLIVELDPTTGETTKLEHGPDYNERHSTPPVNKGIAYYGNELLKVTDPHTPQEKEEEVFVPFYANHMDNTHSIPPLETEKAKYDIPIPAGSVGPLSITARLRYRPFPPRFMRLMAEQATPNVVTEAMVDMNLIVDMATAPSVSVTIGGAKDNTTTALTSALNPSKSGQQVVFTAKVSAGAGTPTGAVTFLEGNTTLGTGTLNNGAATFSKSNLSVGDRSITARYEGSAGYNGSTSSVLKQTVTGTGSSQEKIFLPTVIR